MYLINIIWVLLLKFSGAIWYFKRRTRYICCKLTTKAVRAQQNGEFDSEIVPVSIPQRKGEPILVTKDEGVRENVSVEKLSRLRPAFKKTGQLQQVMHQESMMVLR